MFRILPGFGRVPLHSPASAGAARMDEDEDEFVGTDALKAKQSDHLAKLTTLATAGHWQHLQTHTSHPHSGFDWWMFPTDRPSRGQGNKYKLSKKDIEVLKADAEFMANYRAGVVLVARSWGWNIETMDDETSDKQKWVNYQVRLGKMLDSLRLFGQDDLRENLTTFIDARSLRETLEPWIKALLYSE